MSRHVGARITRLRRARKWTKARLAREATVAYLTLWRIEVGTQTPTLATITRLAKALGVPVSRLVG